MTHDDLLNRFEQLSWEHQVAVVEAYCTKHEIKGPDGLAGQLNYVKAIREGRAAKDAPLLRDFGEIVFTLWALEQLGYAHLTDKFAGVMKIGGNYGDTDPYTGDGINYFKNSLLEMQVGLRMVESGIRVIQLPDHTGEPDYYLEGDHVVLEVKAPASRLGLFQSVVKAVFQIEKSAIPGIVVVTLDHLVPRGKNPAVLTDLPAELQNIILSALPIDPLSNTIGVIAEWCDWSSGDTTVQPMMNTVKARVMENQNVIKKVWQAFSFDEVSLHTIVVSDSTALFPYTDEYKPATDPEVFFNDTWPGL